MSKLHLPDVTLVVADNVCHALTTKAVEECVARVDFAEVIVASNVALHSPHFDARFVPIEFRSLTDADLFRWTWHQYVKTSHLLIIEWDSWVIDASRWNPQWLDFDYLGALWPWHSRLRNGNGGFSLRSRDLLKYIDSRRDEFPNRVHEDDVLCRLHRPVLEQRGFTWGEDRDAIRFAFERSPPLPTFGFHGIFNWKHVLTPSALAERLALAPAYVRSKPEWGEIQ